MTLVIFTVPYFPINLGDVSSEWFAYVRSWATALARVFGKLFLAKVDLSLKATLRAPIYADGIAHESGCISKSRHHDLVLSAIAPVIWAIAGCGFSFSIPAAAKSPAESSLPTISCLANPTSVISGSSVQIAAKAMSPLGLPLSYSYGATAGSVASQGASATLDTQGTAGSISVTCKVVDTQGNAASSTTAIAVQAAGRSRQRSVALPIRRP